MHLLLGRRSEGDDLQELGNLGEKGFSQFLLVPLSSHYLDTWHLHLLDTVTNLKLYLCLLKLFVIQQCSIEIYGSNFPVVVA